MLNTILNVSKRHLRIFDFQNEYVVRCKITYGISSCACVVRGSMFYSYYLTWKKDSGLYIHLPEHPKGEQPRVFLTAELSGCCVGVQKNESVITIRHFNLSGDNGFLDDTINTNRFVSDDLVCRGHWLLPATSKTSFMGNQFTVTRYSKNEIPHSILYHFYGSNFPAAFFGEYSTKESKWKFYYQHGDGDNTTVNDFSY